MKGLETTLENIDKERLRVSRLIHLERVKPDLGTKVLKRLIDLRDELMEEGIRIDD